MSNEELNSRMSQVSDLLASWREEHETFPSLPTEEKNRLKEACWLYDIVSRVAENPSVLDPDVQNLLGSDTSDISKPSRLSISEVSCEDVVVAAAIIMRDEMLSKILLGQPKEVAEHLDTKTLESVFALDQFMLSPKVVQALSKAIETLQKQPDFISSRLKVDMPPEELLQRLLPAKIEIVEES